MFLIVNGKTGMRRVRAIYSGPYLTQWLESHPFKNDPEAPLWVRVRAKSPEEYFKYRSLTRRLGAISKKAGLKKKMHAYLFRHTRITEAASFMTEAEMNEYFGWVQGSNMPGIYVHLSGRNVDDKLLKFYKLKKEEEDNHAPRRCPRCKEINAPAAMFCYKCGLPLDQKTALSVEKASTDVTKALMELVIALARDSNNPEAVKLAQQLAESVKGS